VGGDYAGAEGHLETARGNFEKPQMKSRLTDYLEPLGHLRFCRGDYPSALAAYERGLAAGEGALGPDHPSLAALLLGVGRTEVRLGRLDEAAVAIERARALMEKATDARSPALTRPLLALAELRRARKQPDDAVRLLERALSLPPYQDLTAEAQLTLADTLWPAEQDRPRARALAEQARAWYAARGHRPGTDRAARWLDEHRAPE
jgi:serine/threonine-protein kinase